MGFVDWYKVLQVHPEADRSAIISAHARLAKIYHPGGSAPDGAQFREINKAVDVLRNPARREAFDKELKGPQLAIVGGDIGPDGNVLLRIDASRALTYTFTIIIDQVGGVDYDPLVHSPELSAPDWPDGFFIKAGWIEDSPPFTVVFEVDPSVLPNDKTSADIHFDVVATTRVRCKFAKKSKFF